MNRRLRKPQPINEDDKAALEEMIESTPVDIEGERLTDLAKAYADARFSERQNEAARKDVGGALLPLMQELGVAKHKVDFDDEQDATVRVKVRENLSIDAERLKKAIGAPAFNKLTEPVLSEAKVEAAIQLGDLDPNVVASCTNEHHTDYLEVRFTKKRKRAKETG